MFSQFGIPAIIATAITGFFGLWTKKAQVQSDHTRPDILTTSYSQMLADNQSQLDRLKADHEALRKEMRGLKSEITDLKLDRDEEQFKVTLLRRQVDWLIARVSPEDMNAFHLTFGFAGPKNLED